MTYSAFIFMIKHGLYTDISLEEIVKSHRKNGSPTILVDCSNINKINYLNCKSTFGWNWNLILKHLQDFVQNLKKLGIKPIFYFRGPLTNAKTDKWKYWISKDSETVSKIFDNLKTNSIPEENFCCQDVAYFRFILKYGCQCEVYNVFENIYFKLADEAAKQENCIGILTMNSDYLFFDTKPILSFKKLKFSTLDTRMFKPTDFHNKINFSRSGLKLLGCLAGNDFTWKDNLINFHKRIGIDDTGEKNDVIIEKVADFIKSKNWTGTEEEFPEILEITGLEKELLDNGLAFYDNPRNESICSEVCDCLASSSFFAMIKEKWLRNEIPQGFYNLLHDKIYVEKVNLEDITDTSLPSSALLYRPMRQKMYRILFQEQNVIVKEWCFYREVNLEEPDEVGIHEQEFNDSIPSLEELMSEDNKIQSIRWKLFAYCVGIDESIEMLQKMKLYYFPLYCILNYMLHNGVQLEEWEVNAFIYQAFYGSKNDLFLEEKFCTRSLQLINLFQRGLHNLMFVLITTGSPFSLNYVMPWILFHRQRFIHIYNKLRDKQPIEFAYMRDVEILSDCLKMFSEEKTRTA